MTARVWSAQECALNAESVCASRQLGCVRVSWCSRLHVCVRACVRRRSGRSGFCVRTAGVLVGDRQPWLLADRPMHCCARRALKLGHVRPYPTQLGHGAPRNTVPPLAAWLVAPAPADAPVSIQYSWVREYEACGRPAIPEAKAAMPLPVKSLALSRRCVQFAESDRIVTGAADRARCRRAVKPLDRMVHAPSPRQRRPFVCLLVRLFD